MERTNKFSIALIILLICASGFTKAKTSLIAQQDSSKKLLREFSLFNESQKNGDYKSAVSHGWYVINTNPKRLVRYRLFKKMEKVLWAFYDSAKTDTEKKQIADTTLYLYDKAIKYDSNYVDYYLAKKAYVLETWLDAAPEVIINSYLSALKANPKLSSSWKDRLGLAYTRFADDTKNDYKVKALELYSELSEQEPDNALWLKRIEALAGGDLEKLVEIKKQAWDLDKENTEKAWSYASTCMRNKEYEKALEPLKFLTSKSGDVINYWINLATAYQKLDRTDDAISSYRKLINLQPNNRDNYVNIAIIYQKQHQFSVARSYLYKSIKIDPNWAYPYYLEGQLYEQAARSCGGGKLDFDDRLVFQLAVNAYNQAKRKEGPSANIAGERAAAFKETVPQQQDYFFRGLKAGDQIKVDGKSKGKVSQKECYSWIGKTVVVP